MNWLNWLIANIIKKKCNKDTQIRLGTQVKKKKKKTQTAKNQDLESVKLFWYI